MNVVDVFVGPPEEKGLIITGYRRRNGMDT
jgi:hypothetical protein